MLGSGPVYAALGNHDSYNQYVFYLDFHWPRLTYRPRAQDAPNSLGAPLAQQFSWYGLVLCISIWSFTNLNLQEL